MKKKSSERREIKATTGIDALMLQHYRDLWVELLRYLFSEKKISLSKLQTEKNNIKWSNLRLA